MRNARGKIGSHHLTFELDLPDGRVLRTRISHPPDRSVYGASLWRHILRDQLYVSESEFWRCVRDGVMPDRGAPQPPKNALPADLVHLLIARAGLDEAEVARMTREEAVAALQRHWTEGDD